MYENIRYDIFYDICCAKYFDPLAAYFSMADIIRKIL